MKKEKIVKPNFPFPVPSPELQKALDRFPELVKKKERVAKEKAKIRKNFEKSRKSIFR